MWSLRFMQILYWYAGGGTKLTFKQGPLATAEHTEGSRQGVMKNMDKLAKVAEGKEFCLRVIVVTSKLGRLAHLHLDHLGMVADEVAGDLFAEGKAAALTEHDVRWYVGDHVADMVAARTAGVPGIGVSTGPCSADELIAAGAAYVLPDLTGFPALLREIAVGY